MSNFASVNIGSFGGVRSILKFMRSLDKPTTEPMTELDQRIQENIALLKELRAEQREQKRLAKNSGRGRGRLPLDDALIAQAREKARNKPLKDVALSLGISLRSLYNKGISRKALDAEKAKQLTCEENRM